MFLPLMALCFGVHKGKTGWYAMKGARHSYQQTKNESDRRAAAPLRVTTNTSDDGGPSPPAFAAGSPLPRPTHRRLVLDDGGEEPINAAFRPPNPPALSDRM